MLAESSKPRHNEWRHTSHHFANAIDAARRLPRPIPVPLASGSLVYALWHCFRVGIVISSRASSQALSCITLLRSRKAGLFTWTRGALIAQCTSPEVIIIARSNYEPRPGIGEAEHAGATATPSKNPRICAKKSYFQARLVVNMRKANKITVSSPCTHYYIVLRGVEAGS